VINEKVKLVLTDASQLFLKSLWNLVLLALFKISSSDVQNAERDCDTILFHELWIKGFYQISNLKVFTFEASALRPREIISYLKSWMG